jgi:hypothetical protein
MAKAGAGSDRMALLNRGLQNRAVKNREMHLERVEQVDLEAVPTPYDPRNVDVLDDGEREDLATCERALEGLQRSIVIAGKALATIQRARLYRESHATFDLYCEDRWGMRRAHAYRLIEAWPLAAALSPMGDTNERQVRELLPAAKAHGIETATAVYAEFKALGTKVTAQKLRQAVKALPAKSVAPEVARSVVREVAATGRIPAPGPAPDGDQSDDVIDVEVVEDGAQAVAVLAGLLEKQKQLYDALGNGVIADALLAEPGRGEYLRRELHQYAKRTMHRVRPLNERREQPDAEPG